MNPLISSELIATLSSESVSLTSFVHPDAAFYNQFEWCLNPFLTLRESIRHLQEELDHLSDGGPSWQGEEHRRNTYLLASAILDLVDDCLLARKYDFSKLAGALPVGGKIISVGERWLNRDGGSGGLAAWREQWLAELVRALRVFLSAAQDKKDSALVQSGVGGLLRSEQLRKLQDKRVRIPGAFRSQDLTEFDVLALGEKFVARFPERDHAITVLGLRTAGSYFAPLLHAFLENSGYTDVESLTVRSKHGVSTQEMEALRRCAGKRGKLIIIDEPIGSGGTLAKAVQIARRGSIVRDQIVILTPIHPGARNWKEGSGYQLLSDLAILTLEPEEWHKWKQLDQEAENIVKCYCEACGELLKSIHAKTRHAEQFNQQLELTSEKKGHTRIKRVYEVEVSSKAGTQRRYVLAKSVGWGWLSYHAFLTAERLSQFVPALIGLRNGILVMEWKPQNGRPQEASDRKLWIHRAASYIATRTKTLRLDVDPAADLIFENRNNGLATLAGNLCRAYGRRPAPFFRRGRICHELTRSACPLPTLIDGKMRPLEWVNAGAESVKTDFEHHGLGKTEINIIDPAYDLAEAILTWQLSEEEEKELLRIYVQESGDASIADRLIVNKLVAGVRAMDAAVANLLDSQLTGRCQEFNRDYQMGWKFLVIHTMRYLAGHCIKPASMTWRDPLVVMDVDGVLDKQVIGGFPSTTSAGMKAVSLLHSHNSSVVLNTARSVAELKEYCRHFGFLGGVAEYGAFAWDGTTDNERVLVSPESLEQLEALAERLRKIPGIFLNNEYRYSIRAYTFEDGTTKAIPNLLIQNLISELKLNRLSVHHTYTDTAVVAKETDKGKGLFALLDLAGQRPVKTLAIGDSGADLPMFAAATMGFAPGHIPCRSQAQALGCYIDREAMQPGLLNIVRKILHPSGDTCDRCRSAEPRTAPNNIVLEALRHADESQITRLGRAIIDPMALRSFLAN